MRQTRWVHLLGIGIVAAGVALAGCKKAEQAEESNVQGVIPKGEEGVAITPLATAQLGFATQLPADTEAYFGTLNLPQHLSGMKDSNWAKDLNAFLDDKTPAPSAAKADGAILTPPTSLLASLWGQDFFIALGKGAAAALKPWQGVSTIQSELQCQALMQGSVGSADKGSKPEQMIARLLTNTALLQRTAELLSTLSLPPVMLGVKTDKPDELLKQLVPDTLLEPMKAKARVSLVTTAAGKFTLIEGTFAALLTDELEKTLLEGIPAEQAEARRIVAQSLDAVQAKPFALAYGTAHGHLLVALGTERPNLDFNPEAANALTARPELSFVTPYAARNLVALTFAEAGVLEAARNPEPLQPMMRGVLAGLKSSPTFGGMAAALEPKVQDLGALERDLYTRKPAAAIGVAWWENGLRIELKGGLSPEGLEGKKPLRFAPLLDDPSVLFGLAHHGDPARKPAAAVGVAWWENGLRIELKGGLSPEGLEGKKQLRFAPLLDDPSVLFGLAHHGDPARSAKMRALVEAWVALLHSSTHELFKAGLGGKDGPTVEAWLEKEVVPPLLAFYNSSKTLYQSGTGNEHAWIMDLGGKVPPVPLLPQRPGEAPPKMLRITAVDDVINRELVGQQWAQMEQALTQTLTAFPQLGMKALPPPEASNAPGGITTYAYPVFPEADDLLPCASISDTLLMLGTSKPQHAELATRLLRAKPATDATTLRWRLNFPVLREAVKNFAIGAAADSLRPSMKWIAPLGDAQGRVWIEVGNVRQSITVPVKDTVKYD